MIARYILAGNYFRMQFQRLECVYMESRSTKGLTGSGSDKQGNIYEVPTELIYTNQ